MKSLNQVLLILHFLALVLGFSVSIANIVMSGLMASAQPSEKAVLGRFPPIMSRIGRIGLALLWVSGAIRVYTKWGGFATLTWQFYAKLAAVVALTVTVVYIHQLERRIAQGDREAGVSIASAGKIATSLEVIAVVFAVLTFA